MSDVAKKANAWTQETKVSLDHIPEPPARNLTTITEWASIAYHRTAQA
ncbi:hypothetical protein BFJ71_g10018 [Fusarium oxysporum]|nr:hypothetical protein BFJ71_g10018 [Fusarium oxysporum]